MVGCAGWWCRGECSERNVADRQEISAEVQGLEEELVGELVDGERVWRCYQCAGGFFHVLASIWVHSAIHIHFEMTIVE